MFEEEEIMYEGYSDAYKTKKELQNRIQDYLISEGLFNPEMAIHNVRDLLMDIRDFLDN